MGKRLYVGNLPYDTDEATLRSLFGQDGRTVERVNVVVDRETQRPRGFAFVDLATDAEAQQAVRALDGTMLGTRQLRVTEAEDRRSPGGHGPGMGRPTGGPRDRAPYSAGTGIGSPAPRPAGADMPAGAARAHRFGPDSKPKHERQDAKKAPRRRGGDDVEEDFGGRRGSRRFDDDDE